MSDVILKLKCTKFDFGWGATAEPAWGAYSALQTRQLEIRGRKSKEREVDKPRGGEKREGRTVA